MGEKAADAGQWQSRATVLSRDEADKLNLAGGLYFVPCGDALRKAVVLPGEPQGRRAAVGAGREPVPCHRTPPGPFGQPQGAAGFGGALVTVSEEGSPLSAEGCGGGWEKPSLWEACLLLAGQSGSPFPSGSGGLSHERNEFVRSRKECDSPGKAPLGCKGALPPSACALPNLELSRKLLEPDAHVGTRHHLRQQWGWTGGVFPQTLVEASSVQRALTAGMRSSFLWDEGGNVMSPVVAFLSGQSRWVLKMPSHLVFPFPLLLAHHTSFTDTSMHIWSPSVGKKGDALRSHPSSVLHSEIYVRKSRKNGRTGQTHLSNLAHPLPVLSWQVCTPGRTGGPLLLRLCSGG